MPNCHPQLADCGDPYISGVFFFIFILSGSWVALNLITAALMEGFVGGDSNDQFPIQEGDVRQFQRLWKSLAASDPTKVTLTLDELRSFVEQLSPKPLGLGAPFKNFRRQPLMTKTAPATKEKSHQQAREGTEGEEDVPLTDDSPKEEPASRPREEAVGAAISPTATSVLMQLAGVPVYTFVAVDDDDGKKEERDSSKEEENSLLGDSIAEEKRGHPIPPPPQTPTPTTFSHHHFVFPDDVFDALVSLHYGNDLPRSAGRILGAQRAQRFRKRRLLALLRSSSPSSQRLLQSTASAYPMHMHDSGEAKEGDGGEADFPTIMRRRFEVCRVAPADLLVAAVVVQRAWRLKLLTRLGEREEMVVAKK